MSNLSQLDPILKKISAGHDAELEEMSATIDAVMNGRVPEEQIEQLLTALKMKGETVDEIAGAAQAMRQHMTRIHSRRSGLIDTCGTGGDGSQTFNISTAAALVTAAAGCPVAKHGNRGMTSRSGSANVLAELGVNLDATVAVVERCLDEIGIGFCFAPLLHPAMRHVAAVRKRLAFPTIFNLLGPLCNPASAPYQLLGVGRPDVQPMMAEALAKLGVQRAIVVSGEDGLDEVTLAGVTRVILIESRQLRELRWQPEDFGLEKASCASLVVEGPAASAALIRQVLAGRPGPARDIVVMNAAAALWTAGRDDSLTNCARLASDAIDDQRASRLLSQLVSLSHSA